WLSRPARTNRISEFNAVPHYAYLELKMPDPRGVITVNGNTERSLQTEEHTAALAAEVQSSLSRQLSNPGIKRPDNIKRARSNLRTEPTDTIRASIAVRPQPQPSSDGAIGTTRT
ncbi:hypothetical protein PSTG_19428, partial [Puccinia striiformis f. sp. tritici PST-78]